jgi:hypothetical protein
MAAHIVTLTESEAFFYEHAGYSYDPASERPTSGRTRGAIHLAYAEREAARRGWETRWDIDADADIIPTDNYFVSGEPQWVAALVTDEGEIIAALYGIDLGTADPNGDPYARVVAAELAYETL